MRSWIAAVLGLLFPLHAAAAPSPPDRFACTTAADCVVSCDDDCCPNCGCRSVVSRAAADEDRRTRASRCTPDVRRRCPDLGCALDTSLVVPVCVAGRCSAAGEGRPFSPVVVPPPPVPPVPEPARPVPVAPPPAPESPPFVSTPMLPWTRAVSLAPPETRCSAAADCTISCEDDCCEAPCGCTHAVNVTTAKRFHATRAARCKDRPPGRCPPVGCAYHPAFGATCDRGTCVAVRDPLGGVETSPEPPPLAEGRSNLPGVRIEFPKQPVEFTRKQLARGVRLRWTLVVEEGGRSVVPDRVPNSCGNPGKTGLVAFPQVIGHGRRSCACDTGLCVPVTAPTVLRRGRDEGAYRFTGRVTEGPSDTAMPDGPPFPLGDATFEVVATGTVDGRPFRVEGRLRLKLKP